jgi:hypothetical protein
MPISTLTRLILYAATVLGLAGVAILSVSILAITLNSFASKGPQIEVRLSSDDIPLPPVIEPQNPPLERRLSRLVVESSITTIGPPSGQDADRTVVGPAETSESILMLPPRGAEDGDP